MYQRYTVNALQDIFNAEEEAKITRQPFIGSAHLLIGLIKNKNSLISRVLKEKGLTLEKVRKEVDNIIFKGSNYQEGKLPFGKECELILDIAFKICTNRGFDIFDSEDILFGIINKKDCDAYEVLSNLAINPISLIFEINKIKRRKYGESTNKYYSLVDSFYLQKEEYFNASENEETINLKSDEKILISKLKTLGISNHQQLLENDIFYWWQKRFRDIQKKNENNQTEMLIDINSAREDLELTPTENLIKILKNNKNSAETSKKREKEKTNNSSSDSDKESAFIFEELGEKAYDFGQFEEAIKYFTKAIEIDPLNANYYHRRGAAIDSLGQYSEAINDYDQAIYLDQDNSDFYNSRGVAKTNLKFFSGAIKDLNKAIKLDPSNQLISENLKKVQELQKIKEQKENQKIFLKEKESAKNWKSKGDKLKPKIETEEIKLNTLIEAIFCYSKALEIDSKYKEELINIKEVYISRGICNYLKLDYKNAAQDFTKSINLDKNNCIAFLYRGEAKKKLNDQKGYKKDYEYAFKLETSDIVFYKRGIMKLNIRKFKESIEDFSNSILLNPNNKEVLLKKGEVNFKIRNFKTSITDFTKLIEFDNQNADAYFRRGDAKFELSNLGLKHYLYGAYIDYESGFNLEPNKNYDHIKSRYIELKKQFKNYNSTKGKNIRNTVKRSNFWDKFEDFFSL